MKFCSQECFHAYFNKNHPMKGKKLSWLTERNLKNNPMKSEKTRKKSSISHRCQHSSIETEIKKGQHLSPSTEIKKGQHLSKKTEFPFNLKYNRPTKIEQKIIDIINTSKLPFKYVGDGKLNINGLNPDFIDNTDKYIIEVFGNYWHNPKRKKFRKIIETDTEDGRIKFFEKLNYKILILWENEINRLANIELKNKIESWYYE